MAKTRILKNRKPSFLQKVFCPRKIALSNAKDLLLFFKLGQPFFNYGWLGFARARFCTFSARFCCSQKSGCPRLVQSATHGKLLPFGDGKGLTDAPHIPMHLIDYIELVDWTGRKIRPNKHGVISEAAPPILARLGIEQGNWLQNCQKLEEDFRQVIGPVAAINKFCQAVGQKWLQGIHSCRRCFG